MGKVSRPKLWLVTDKMDDVRRNSLKCDRVLRDLLSKKWTLYRKLSEKVLRFSLDSEVYDRKTLVPILATLIKIKDTSIHGIQGRGSRRDLDRDSLICADAVFPHWGKESFKLAKCE